MLATRLLGVADISGFHGSLSLTRARQPLPGLGRGGRTIRDVGRERVAIRRSEESSVDNRTSSPGLPAGTLIQSESTWLFGNQVIRDDGPNRTLVVPRTGPSEVHGSWRP